MTKSKIQATKDSVLSIQIKIYMPLFLSII